MSRIAPGVLKNLGLALSGRSREVRFQDLSYGDWETLVESAERHRVAPLLYHELQVSGWPAWIPSLVTRQLKSAYYGASGLNLMLYEELARVLASLGTEARVSGVVLLKGAALASTLYSNIALRPMSDLDLLLPRERIASAIDTLGSLGYRAVSPEMAPGHAEAVHYHAALHGGPHGSVGVELHWGLIAGETDWRSPSLDWFWKETEPWAFESPTAGRIEALQLRPTAHLLYLAAHLLLQHGAAEAQLVWYFDLHLLLCRRASRIDWDDLRSRAREFRWTAALRGALESSRDFFATPIPEGFLDSLRADEDRAASRLVRNKTEPMGRGARVWAELGSLDWRGRARLVRSILLPSPSYLRWRYSPRPSWLWPLGYPYRWGVVLLEAAGSMRKLLFGRRRETHW